MHAIRRASAESSSGKYASSSPRNKLVRASSSTLSFQDNQQQQQVRRTPINKTWTWFAYVLEDIYTLTGFVYFVWLLVGCVFYVHYGQFTWPTALYFSVEAGLAIGFCQPGDVDDFSKLFTLAFVLVGTTVVSGCIAQVITRMLSPGVSILVTKTRSTEEKYRDIKWPYTRSPWWENNPMPFIHCAWQYLIIFISYDQYRLQYSQFLVFLLWMGLGCIYGMLVEKWTFITSLYWAVTGSSGGGLQSAPCNDGTGGPGQPLCDMGIRGLIMAIFFIGGVPFYAMTMGNFAFLLASRSMEAHILRMVRQPINHDEFIFSANILSPEGHKSTSLNQGEFILLNFMRLGIVSGEQIEQFSEQFRELDTAKRGVLELEDLQKIGVVVERDHAALDSPLPQNNSPPTAFLSRIEEVEVAVEEEEVHSYNTNNDL